jgi:hypothetical protein
MKKIITVMLLCVSVIAAAQEMGKVAQPKMSGDEKSAKIIALWDKATGGLNDEQKSKITALATERFAKMEEFRKANKGKKDLIKAESKKLKTDFRNALKTMLTEEQKTKVKAYVMANKKNKKVKSKDNKSDAIDNIDIDDLEMD